MEPLVRAAEVAKLLNVQIATVYDLARRGVLPHVRVRDGGSRPLVRFHLDTIEKFLRDRTIDPTGR